MPDNFSLVICDGPPGSGHGGRYGLLPVMQNRLATRCTILLDDADRGPERDTAERWLNMLDASMVMGGHGKLFAIIRVGQQRCGQTTAEGGMQPSVTVGIPAYNSETYIRQSIESVLNQTHSNLKLIISDNPSSDKTQENCLHYAKQDARVYYYRQERNIGVFRNYNDVFLKSTSPYFKWQSSSDWCENDALESCIEVLESHPDVVLVCPQVSLVDSHGEQQAYTEDFGLEMDKPEERFMYLLANIQLCNVFNGVIRASALKKTRLNQIFKGSDITLLAELALQGKFVLLPERKWFRRMTPLTASRLKTSAQKAEFFAGEQADLEHYQTLKTLKALTFAVIRAPISVSAKLTCLKFLLRKFFWVRNSLWQEIMRHG